MDIFAVTLHISIDVIFAFLFFTTGLQNSQICQNISLIKNKVIVPNK